MQTRTILAAAAIAGGGLLGWLTASEPSAIAQEKPDKSLPAGGDVLPKPPQPFRGTINLRARDSKSDFPQPVRAPASAPNILLVLLDDVGYGATSTFGGPCQAPTLTKLSENGLKYNHFHTTALCSPTRAALITGRNHHSVHTAGVDALYEEFRAKGVKIKREPEIMPYDNKDFDIEDCNGYVLCFGEDWQGKQRSAL
jgi:hypothetical protein